MFLVINVKLLLSLSINFIDVFDLQNDSKIIDTINKKVEKLAAINNELQKRDLLYEEYLFRIKRKKEELSIKSKTLVTKEEENLNKYLVEF